MLFDVAIFHSFSLLCGIPLLELLSLYPNVYQLFVDNSISYSRVFSRVLEL